MILKTLRMGCLQDGWSLKRRGCQLRWKTLVWKEQQGHYLRLSDSADVSWEQRSNSLLQAACRRHQANFKVTWPNSSSPRAAVCLCLNTRQTLHAVQWFTPDFSYLNAAACQTKWIPKLFYSQDWEPAAMNSHNQYFIFSLVFQDCRTK